MHKIKIPIVVLLAIIAQQSQMSGDSVEMEIMECWPRDTDLTQPGAKQFTGWPITIGMD